MSLLGWWWRRVVSLARDDIEIVGKDLHSEGPNAVEADPHGFSFYTFSISNRDLGQHGIHLRCLLIASIWKTYDILG